MSRSASWLNGKGRGWIVFWPCRWRSERRSFEVSRMTAAATILQVERRLASAERLSSGKRWGRFERVQDGFCPLLSCPKPKVWARPPVPPTGVFPQPDGEQPLLLTDGGSDSRGG